MPSVKVYNQSGKAAGNLELSAGVFGVDYNEALIHQVIVAQQNNARQGTKCTLTRAEVSGGGIKPWRQKGTGRARQGSSRSPQWIHGGVVFAPKPRDFSQKVNKQAKTLAIKSALSQKVAQEEFVVLDALKLTAPKTKEVNNILKNLSLNCSVLLIITGKEEGLVRAANNLPCVKTTTADLINVRDIVAYNKCLITKDAVKLIEEAYND